MNDRTRSLALFLLYVMGHCLAAAAQTSCPALSLPTITAGTNIFTAQQEAALGNAMDSHLRQTMHIVQDPALVQPLLAVANRLEAQMPPEHPGIVVALFDSSSAEAFSIPGHVYLSRKIVAVTRSEDELAGILAHEMGHILSHHTAQQVTDNFRRVLNVDHVSDDADVVAKWNDLLSNYKRVKVKAADVERAEKLERQRQEQADSIALYLAAKAGYSTQAFVDVFDRIAETQGKTGNAWSDLFGMTTPDSKRLRQLVKENPSLPPDCVATHAAAIANYPSWRSEVIERKTEARNVSVPGLVSQREFVERLRPEISTIRISLDGKYVLAQDDSSITVLTRVPLKFLFRIDAPGARPAQFTPDSSGIVFHIAPMGSSPRVEKWTIASQKRTEVHEIYVRRGCLASALTPDGRTLVCLTGEDSGIGLQFNLDLLDTASGTSYYHKKDWVAVDALRLDYATLWEVARSLMVNSEELYSKFLRVAISPDGRFLLAHSPENALAFDLVARAPFSAPNSIRELLSFGRFTFLADGHFMGVGGGSGNDAKVVEFPSGHAVYPNILVGGAQVIRVAHGDDVLLSPIRDSALGAINLKENKLFFQSKRKAFDIWDTQGIGERENGDLIVVDMTNAKIIETVRLPDAELGDVRAASVSPDFNWLALSQDSRGAVWNLQTGQREYHLRGFRGAYFKPGGDATVDFPKYLKTERTIASLSLRQNEVGPKYTIDEKEHAFQEGRFLVSVVPATPEGSYYRNVTIEVRDVDTRELLWSRHFGQERPGYFGEFDTNTLILRWELNSKEVQSIAKQNSELAARLAPLKKRDGMEYVEVLDFDTGKLRFAVVIDTGKNSIQAEDMAASSNRLILADDRNRLLVYSSDGTLLATVAGTHPTISRAANLLSARTQTDELTLYDLQSMQRRATYTFDSRVAYDTFKADGSRLLVVTADQKAFLINPAGDTQDSSAKNDAKPR